MKKAKRNHAGAIRFRLAGFRFHYDFGEIKRRGRPSAFLSMLLGANRWRRCYSVVGKVILTDHHIEQSP